MKKPAFLFFAAVVTLLISQMAFSSSLLDPSATRLQPADLEYLGAFKVSIGQFGKSTFAYGGNALAWRLDGDPNGDADGYPGSLFLVGHEIDQLVAEISIPEPIMHLGNTSGLNDVEMLQPFADVTGG